jgi:cytochrome c-type biogenesis protein CcsB
MDGHGLVWLTLALFGVTVGVASVALLLRERFWMRAAVVCLVAAFLAGTAVLAARWVEAGRPPFKTRYETLLLYPWCLAVVTLLLLCIHRLFVIVPFAALASVFCLGYGLWNPDIELVLLPPALQSAWFVPHVVAYFVSYAGLLISCVLAALAILNPSWCREWGGATALPPGGGTGPVHEPLARHAHQAAVFGVTALTLGLVMGAAWGKFAWGDYWSWDPKENWALVTWLAYMAYLHLARMPGWQGRRSAWLLVVSFGAVMFTWLGMHLLPTAEGSLHVYQ